MKLFRIIVKAIIGIFKRKPHPPHRPKRKPHQTDSGNTKPTMTMRELIGKIADTNAAFLSDLEKYAKFGNKTAGARARKASLELERLNKEFRKRSVHEMPTKE